MINILFYRCNFISVQKAVKPVTFSCLLHIRHLKEMEMRGIKLLETCPYCGFADIPPKDDQVFCCLNLDCMRETCRSVVCLFCNIKVKLFSSLPYSASLAAWYSFVKGLVNSQIILDVVMDRKIVIAFAGNLKQVFHAEMFSLNNGA